MKKKSVSAAMYTGFIAKVVSLSLVLTLGISLLFPALPQGMYGSGSVAYAAGSVYGDRPLVGVINYSGLTGQNKTWDEASLTPPAFNHRLPFYAISEDDDSRVTRTSNTAQEIVYHTTSDITNFRIYAAFDDTKSYNLNSDIQVYSSSNGITYTAAPSPGLSGKLVHELVGADNWQKATIATAYEPGVRYVKVVIAKTDDGPLNPQIMRIELYHRNSSLTDLVRIVDNLDDFSKLHSYSGGITLASANPEKFALVAADDNEAAIVDQQIAYANSAQIDYIAYLDMRTNFYTHTPRVFDLYRQSPNKGNLKYSVILGSPDGDGETWEMKMERVLDYFSDSFYVRVHDNRPLLYVYGLSSWSKSQIDELRDESIDAGLGDPYVVGMTDNASYSSFLDGASEYATVEAGVAYNFAGTSHSIPLVSLGVNDEPRHDNPPSWGIWGPTEPPVTVPQLQADLTEALDWTSNNPGQNPANTVLMYAWNEHAEAASNIEPTLNTDGTINTTMLDAVGDVLENYNASPGSGSNLLINGGFESGTSNWYGQAATITSETGIVQAGSRAVLASSRSAPWGSAAQDIRSALLTNGQGLYSASAWARYASGSDSTAIVVNTTDSSGSHWFTIGYATVGTGYTRISGSASITWTGTLSSAIIYLQGGSSTSNLYIDDFSLSTSVVDTTPPASITDLAAGSATANSLQLNWTAPGDDGASGTASSYDIRYSTSSIHSGNWASATQVTGEPAPLAGGSSQSFTVTGLSPNTTYYFAIKTSDEVPNESGLSNIASGTTSASGGNLLTNGGFESGTSGWSGQGATISSNNVHVHSGSSSVLATGRVDTWASPAQDIKSILQTNGQGTYSASAWARYASGSDPTVVMVNLTDSSGSHWFAMGYTNVGASYAQITGNANITWTGTLTSATIYIQGASSTADLYVDDFSLNKL